MKFLRKANKGALLFLLAFIVLVVYLAVVASAQSADQPGLKQGCENYLAMAQKYSMLPEDYQSGSVLMTVSQQDDYLAQAKNSLTPLFDSGSTAALNATVQQYKTNLQQLFGGSATVTSNTLTVTQYSDFTYAGDLISVTFSYTVKTTGATKGADGSLTPYSFQNGKTGVITFKKANGNYTIVSVNVYNPVAASRSGGGRAIQMMGG